MSRRHIKHGAVAFAIIMFLLCAQPSTLAESHVSDEANDQLLQQAENNFALGVAAGLDLRSHQADLGDVYSMAVFRPESSANIGVPVD